MNTWLKVVIVYNATSTGGAKLSINGHSQSAWSVSGNYARPDGLQRLQLWYNVAGSADFDDVVVTTPDGTGSGLPIDNSPPTVTGSAAQGQTLTTTSGAWGSSPTAYSYSWQDCDGAGNNCAAIGGATSTTYAVQASDAGHTIRAAVAARNSVGSASSTRSAQTAVVPGGGGGTSTGGLQSVAFWLGWSGGVQESQIPWGAVTQVDLFALKTTNGTALDTTSNGLSRMNVPAWTAMIHQHGRLALVSIGGSNDADWVDACDSANDAGFTSNLVSYMVSNGFDGVDIDIESLNANSQSTWNTCVQSIAQAAHAVKTQAGNTPIVSTDVGSVVDGLGCGGVLSVAGSVQPHVLRLSDGVVQLRE